MSVKQVIKRMTNKQLIDTLNKIRMEQIHKRRYGNYGTGRYVPSSEFWRGHISDLKKELALRKRKGLVSKLAGKTRR